MRIYHAGAVLDGGERFIKALRDACNDLPYRLLSYYHLEGRKANRHTKAELEAYLRECPERLFVDSGAYSADNSGAVINLGSYIEFLKRNPRAVLYANLDVIGDWRATQRNQAVLERNGLKPLPVFHYGEPKELLRELMEGYDFIAIGGLVMLRFGRGGQRHEEEAIRFLDMCFSVAMGKRLHGFGVNRTSLLLRYPWFSTDSTAAVVSGAFGEVATSRVIGGSDTTASCRTIELEKIRPEALKYTDKRAEKRHMLRKVESIKRMVERGETITEIWKRRGVVWES